MKQTANAKVKHITVEAVVIRKDGSREDQGVIAEWDRDNPLRNKGSIAFSRLKDFFRR